MFFLRIGCENLFVRRRRRFKYLGRSVPSLVTIPHSLRSRVREWDYDHGFTFATSRRIVIIIAYAKNADGTVSLSGGGWTWHRRGPVTIETFSVFHRINNRARVDDAHGVDTPMVLYVYRYRRAVLKRLYDVVPSGRLKTAARSRPSPACGCRDFLAPWGEKKKTTKPLLFSTRAACVYRGRARDTRRR